MAIKKPMFLASLGVTTTRGCACFFLLCGSIWLSAQTASQQPNKAQDQIGYKSAADAEQKKTLLLKDFQPVPDVARAGAQRRSCQVLRD